MKNFICILFIILASLSGVFATDNSSAIASSTDNYTISLENGTQVTYKRTYEDEKCYLFWLGYEIILQESVQGGMYVYDEITKNFRGYATSMTSIDFFKKPSVQNVSVMMLIPADILEIMFKLLGDVSTASYLSDYGNEPMLCAMIYRMPSADKIENTVSFFAGKALDDYITACGYDPAAFYKRAEEANLMTRDELVNEVMNGASVSKLIMDERVELQNIEKNKERKSFITRRNLYICLITLFVIFFGFVTYLSIIAKKNLKKYKDFDE